MYDRVRRIRLHCAQNFPCIAPERQALLQQAIQEAIRQKPEAHCFEERAQVTELQEMVEIGG